MTPGFVTELAGLRLKTETFSDGAPLAELLGQGGPRELFCGGEESNNTKVGKNLCMHEVIIGMSKTMQKMKKRGW